MSLKVWLPLNGDLRNQGCTGYTITAIEASPTFTTGKIGQCYQRANTSSQITNGLQIQDNLVTTFGTTASVAVWVKPLGTHTHYNGTILSSGNWNAKRWAFGVSQDNSQVDILCGGYNNYISCTVPVNQWTHLASTFENGVCKLYKNGVYIGEKSGQAAFDSDANWTGICRETYAGGYFGFNGCINDLRIYDHALSAAEVKEISQGLVLHYKLDGFQGGYGNKNLLARYVVPGQAAPTSTANGGRTTWLGDYKITIPATENADTYFRLFMTEQLTSGTTYTISCKVSGLLSGSYYRFPLFAQNNTSMGVLNLDHNGLCSLTFTMNWTGTQTAATGANGETVYVNFLDDSARAIASGQGAITLYDFKLEKGSSATAWCPSDASLTKIQDSSGYGNNGIINSNPIISLETARYNYSISFDGVDDCIKIPFNDIIKDKNYTVSVWTYKTSIGTKNYQTILGGPSGFELEARSSSSTSPLYRIHNWGGGTTAYEFNKWNLFTFVHTDSNSKLYINGELKITGTSANIPTGNYYIGAWNSVTGQNYEGLMSDFRIYCTALDADDILQLYHTSAKIDNKANFHTYEINEHGTNKLTKTGIMYDNMVEPFIILPDGSYWQLMLFHYVDGGRNLFTSSNATNCNDFGLYSRLKDINNFTYNGKYEFYVIQDDIEYRWTQTNQPTASSIAGLTTVSGYNNPVNGLAKASQSNTYIGYNAWWGACGCWTSHSSGGRTGIPGFGSHDANGICTRYLALYARIEKPRAKLSNLTASAVHFIEF